MNVFNFIIFLLIIILIITLSINIHLFSKSYYGSRRYGGDSNNILFSEYKQLLREFKNIYEMDEIDEMDEMDEMDEIYNEYDKEYDRELTKKIKLLMAKIRELKSKNNREEEYVESKKQIDINILSNWLRLSKNIAILFLNISELKKGNIDPNILYFIPAMPHLSEFKYRGKIYKKNDPILINYMDDLPNGTFWKNYNNIVI